MSDRASLVQVPMRASLVFPACERAGEQTVRILCVFSVHKMLYCAEKWPGPRGAGCPAGNSLKCHLQPIEIKGCLFTDFLHEEILDSTGLAK